MEKRVTRHRPTLEYSADRFPTSFPAYSYHGNPYHDGVFLSALVIEYGLTMHDITPQFLLSQLIDGGQSSVRDGAQGIYIVRPFAEGPLHVLSSKARSRRRLAHVGQKYCCIRG